MIEYFILFERPSIGYSGDGFLVDNNLYTREEAEKYIRDNNGIIRMSRSNEIQFKASIQSRMYGKGLFKFVKVSRVG